VHQAWQLEGIHCARAAGIGQQLLAIVCASHLINHGGWGLNRLVGHFLSNQFDIGDSGLYAMPGHGLAGRSGNCARRALAGSSHEPDPMRAGVGPEGQVGRWW